MPELGALEPGQAASLAGLAPVARQSGRWTGRAFIRGGRANVRQAVYMPALVATRFNPDMKAKYKQLINAGKPAKVALTAVMRKLILLANALLKANQELGRQNPLDQNGYSSRDLAAFGVRSDVRQYGDALANAQWVHQHAPRCQDRGAGIAVASPFCQVAVRFLI